MQRHGEAFGRRPVTRPDRSEIEAVAAGFAGATARQRLAFVNLPRQGAELERAELGGDVTEHIAAGEVAGGRRAMGDHVCPGAMSLVITTVETRRAERAIIVVVGLAIASADRPTARAARRKLRADRDDARRYPMATHPASAVLAPRTG